MSDNRSRKLRGIIFDVDGTLADTEEIHRIAFNRTFQEFNLNWYWSEEKYIELLSISGGKERMANFGSSLQKEFRTKKEFQTLISDMHKRKSTIYREVLSEKKTSLRPGVLRLIDELITENISLNIATSSSLENVNTLLKFNLGSEWRKLFDVVESSDTTKEKKPDPAVYKNVLKKSLLHAEQVIAIEDTLNGLTAAVLASLKTIITTHPMTSKNIFHESCLVIDCMGEPNRPFEVVTGKQFGHSYLNLSLIEKLLNQ